MPEISVIIPTYNSADYLGSAIKSVLDQTFQDFELLIIDDGSLDHTMDTVKRFKDERIVYSSHLKNQGLSSARNTGIKNAKGRYLAWLDADDLFCPGKLEKQLSFLKKNPNIGLVAGGYERIAQNGEPFFINLGPGRLITLKDQLLGHRFPICTTLLRREWLKSVGGFDSSCEIGEDWDFHTRLAIAGCRIFSLKDVVGKYRFLPNSRSMKIGGVTEWRLAIIHKIYSSEKLDESYKKLKPIAESYVHLRAAAAYYLNGNMDNGKEHLQKALKLNPEFQRNDFEKALCFFIFWALYCNEHSPNHFFEFVIENLPDNMYTRSNLNKKFRYLYKRQAVSQTIKKRKWFQGIIRFMTLFSCYPHYLKEDLQRLILHKKEIQKRHD